MIYVYFLCREEADEALDRAQRVIEALKKAKEAQDKAQAAIDKAQRDITETETHLTQVESENAVASVKSNSTLRIVLDLHKRLEALKIKFAENELNVRRASDEANKADELAVKAQKVVIKKSV